MTREHAKELLPFITAYANGEALQFKDDSGMWVNVTGTLSFNNPFTSYRIKPRLHERWVVLDEEGFSHSDYYDTREQAEDRLHDFLGNPKGCPKGWRVVHLVEAGEVSS